jgi:hypothetical protein
LCLPPRVQAEWKSPTHKAWGSSFGRTGGLCSPQDSGAVRSYPKFGRLIPTTKE